MKVSGAPGKELHQPYHKSREVRPHNGIMYFPFNSWLGSENWESIQYCQKNLLGIQRNNTTLVFSHIPRVYYNHPGTLSFQRIDNVSHIARESSEGREEILSECLSENDRGEEDEDGGNGDRVCVIEILASWSPNKSFPRREHCFRNPNLFDCRRTARRWRRRKLGSGTGR